MGVQRVVRFPAGPGPDWAAVAAELAAAGDAAVVRMIDGLPAFPDEPPPADWTEVRVGLAAGMVTVRRPGDGREWAVVTWGTADPALAAAAAAVCRAAAAAGGGESAAAGR